MPGGIKGFEAFEEAKKNPLSGFDYSMREKEAPSFFDTILKKEPPTGVEAGSDAYNKFYGIGKKEIDPYYMLKTMFDTMGGGPTEGDLEEDKEAKYQQQQYERPVLCCIGWVKTHRGSCGNIKIIEWLRRSVG